MNPNAKIEKNAAIPKHHPDPTFTIQSGTINGIVRVNANLYRNNDRCTFTRVAFEAFDDIV